MRYDESRATQLLREKMNKVVGHRADLWINDYKVLDADHAVIIVGFLKDSGHPEMADVQAFIEKTSEGRLTCNLMTANIHEEGAVSVVSFLRRPTRPAKDAKAMAKVVANTFLDTRLNETWEMDTSRGVLSRVLDEDINTILDERQRRLGHSTKAHLTFASLVETKSPGHLQIGDTAKFVSHGRVYDAEVVQVKADSVKVKLSNGEIIPLDRDALFNIRAGKDSEQKQRQIQHDYYTKLYGKEFADQLLSN